MYNTQPSPPLGTPEAVGDKAADPAGLTTDGRGPPSLKVGPRGSAGKEHGAEGGKFTTFEGPQTRTTRRDNRGDPNGPLAA